MREILFLATIWMASVAAAAQAANYQLTPVGTLASVAALNNRGQVVGSADGPAFWANGRTTLLAPLGIADVRGINDRGDITGGMQVTLAPGWTIEHAFRYRMGGIVEDLDPGSELVSAGFGINAAGVVTGYKYNPDLGPGGVAVIFTNGTAQELGVPGDIHGNSTGLAISRSGVVVGSGGGPGSGRGGPFVMRNGVVTTLGNFGGQFGTATGVNSLGIVVGAADIPSGESRAFVYGRLEKRDLDPDGLYCGSKANRINDKGQIVGSTSMLAAPTEPGALCQGGVPFAAIFADGRATNLNTLLDPVSGQGWQLKEAIDINERGQIVGIGTDSSGQTRVFLLTPTP